MEKEREKYYRNQKNWSKVGDITSLFFKWILSPLGVLSFLYMLYDTATEMGFIAFLIRVGLWVLGLSILVAFIHYTVKYERELGRGFNKVGRKVNPFNWIFLLNLIINIVYCMCNNHPATNCLKMLFTTFYFSGFDWL